MWNRDLITAVEPELGVGIDFSEEMVNKAKLKYPHLEFIKADAHNFIAKEEFDVIIISDLVNDLFDVQTVFERINKYSTT